MWSLANCKVFPGICGRSNIAGGLKKSGTSASTGQFPFLGVWCHNHTTESCFCSVNIITTQHVVTAAHCLDPKEGEEIVWQNTTIHFGRYDLAATENEIQVRTIIDAVKHKGWNNMVDSYDGDIAVLRLNQTITFGVKIQPVCLPDGEKFIGGSSNGSVVSRNHID